MAERLVFIPYSKIKKGSRVVVYGADGMTFQILEQNQVSKWMDVICFLDKNYRKKAGGKKVYPPKKIKYLSYDYVLVSSLANRDIMVDTLLKYGVDKTKIVWITQEDTTSEVSNYESYAEAFIQECYDKERLWNAYFHIKWLVKNRGLVYEGFVQKVENMLDTPKDMMEKRTQVILFSFLLEINERRDLELWVKAMISQLKLNKREVVQYLGNYCADLYFLTWKKTYLRYREFFQDMSVIKKKYIHSIVKRDKLLSYIKPYKENKRVAVICYCLCMKYEWSAPNRLTVGICEHLAERGYEVDLYVEDSLIRDTSIKTTRMTTENYKLSKYNRKYNRQKISDKVRIYYLSSDNRKKSIPRLAEKIAKRNPNVIYNMSDTTSLLAYAFEGIIPVMQLYLSGCVSAVPADGHMSGQPIEVAQEECMKYGIQQKKYFQAPMAAIFPPEGEKMGRNYYGIQQSDFVMLSIGHDFDSILTRQFVDTMCRLLKQNSDIKWLIVGPKTNSYLMEAYSDLVQSKRILWRTKEVNMTSIFDVSDVYINPQRMGGGYGIAQSMTEGVPVLMNTYKSDGQAWLGIEKTIPGGLEELYEEIVHCHEDRNYLQKLADIQKERSKSFSFSHLIDEIICNTNYVVDEFYKENGMR